LPQCFKNVSIGSAGGSAYLSWSLSTKYFISTADAVSGWYLGRFRVPRKILFLNLYFALAGVCSSCSAIPSCSRSDCNYSSSFVSPFSSNSRLVTVLFHVNTGARATSHQH
jgi:hypothetical protein